MVAQMFQNCSQNVIHSIKQNISCNQNEIHIQSTFIFSQSIISFISQTLFLFSEVYQICNQNVFIAENNSLGFSVSEQ